MLEVQLRRARTLCIRRTHFACAQVCDAAQAPQHELHRPSMARSQVFIKAYTPLPAPPQAVRRDRVRESAVRAQASAVRFSSCYYLSPSACLAVLCAGGMPALGRDAVHSAEFCNMLSNPVRVGRTTNAMSASWRDVSASMCTCVPSISQGLAGGLAMPWH